MDNFWPGNGRLDSTLYLDISYQPKNQYYSCWEMQQEERSWTVSNFIAFAASHFQLLICTAEAICFEATVAVSTSFILQNDAMSKLAKANIMLLLFQLAIYIYQPQALFSFPLHQPALQQSHKLPSENPSNLAFHAKFKEAITAKVQLVQKKWGHPSDWVCTVQGMLDLINCSVATRLCLYFIKIS